MKILVSGATGFIGRAIVRHLLDAGHEVRAMSRSGAAAMQKYVADESGRQALAEGRLTFAQADVTKPETLLAAVDDVQIVVQAAQFTGAPVEDPARGLTYMAVDRNGTMNLLSAILQLWDTYRRRSGRYRADHGPFPQRCTPFNLHERHQRLSRRPSALGQGQVAG